MFSIDIDRYLINPGAMTPPTFPRVPAKSFSRRFWRPVLISLSMILVITAGIFALALHAIDAPLVPDATSGAGEAGMRDGLAIALLHGDATACGIQAGKLLRDRLLATMRVISLRRSFQLDDAQRTALTKGLSADHKAELEALAQAGRVDRDALFDANLALDTQCTVLLTGADGKGPVRMARNMDYFPAQLLGPATVVTVWRLPGKHAVASIGWPGYAGVISGMNDAGLVATVLKNSRYRQTSGTPLTFRVREILESAKDLDAALAAFRQSPVSSDHFVVLADRTRAAVAWYDGTFHRRDPVAGVLTCSNGKPNKEGDQEDDRTQALRALMAKNAAPNEIQLKQAMTQVYLRDINAQTMFFRPDLREVDLALSHGLQPAAKQPYHRIPLGSWLDGGKLDSVTISTVGAVEALKHY